MRDKDLYATILGIRAPWKVTDVELEPDQEEVTVHIEYSPSAALMCPNCDHPCQGYDVRPRRWRHLDTCQYRTVLAAKVPRVKCPDHGVHQIDVPWSEPGSSFTALFEALVIDWMKETSLSAVGRRLRLSWDQVDGIQSRAVRRGLARRKLEKIERLGVDETSFQKRHEYVTVVCDADRSRVLYVADGRGNGVLGDFYKSLSQEQLSGVQSVAMDMWRPYIKDTLSAVPGAEQKIAFDRFHVAKYLSDAVNNIRKQEHRELRSEGDDRLTRTKFLWLQNPENMTEASFQRFEEIRDSNLKVARAWAIKETARELWGYVRRGWAEKAWKKWFGWVDRCRLAPMKKAGRTLKEHLWGILNAVVMGVTNATSESINSRIQWIKKTACGFRNRQRFRNAILFHCGGLDLHPSRLSAHTMS